MSAVLPVSRQALSHAGPLEPLEPRTLLSAAMPAGMPHPPAAVAALVAQQTVNEPPVPAIAVGSRFVPLNTPVTFSAAGTTDPENDPLAFAWNFNDGTETQAGVVVQHTFTGRGIFPVVLTVTDARGNIARQRIRMVAGIERPVPQITFPAEGDTFRAGQRITAFGTATDTEDGVLPDSAFTWRASLVRGRASRLLAGPVSGERFLTFDVPGRIRPSPNQFIRITLTARDSEGFARSTSVNLPTETAELILQSNFDGIRLRVNGRLVATPRTLLSAVGGVYTISAPPTQDRGTFTAIFRQWSDEGARTHRIRVGEGGRTLFAIYGIEPAAESASARTVFSTRPIALTAGRGDFPADPLA